jgi:hypothetical protein
MFTICFPVGYIVIGGGEMNNKITKKVKAELKEIVDRTGYWSTETKEYIEQYPWYVAKRLHSMAQIYNKYRYGL